MDPGKKTVIATLEYFCANDACNVYSNKESPIICCAEIEVHVVLNARESTFPNATSDVK